MSDIPSNELKNEIYKILNSAPRKYTTPCTIQINPDEESLYSCKKKCDGIVLHLSFNQKSDNNCGALTIKQENDGPSTSSAAVNGNAQDSGPLTIKQEYDVINISTEAFNENAEYDGAIPMNEENDNANTSNEAVNGNVQDSGPLTIKEEYDVNHISTEAFNESADGAIPMNEENDNANTSNEAVNENRLSGRASWSVNLSPELAKLLGADVMTIHEVNKKLRAFIKERNLQDPKHKKYAICDEEFKKLFNVKRVKILTILKYAKKHFICCK